MNCFYHRDVAAVGICKNCNRGLCGECAKVVGEGLACADRCETSVAAINQLLARSSASYPLARGSYLRTGLLFLLASAPFIFLGVYNVQRENRSGYMIVFFGAFMALLGLSYLWSAYGYGKSREKPDS